MHPLRIGHVIGVEGDTVEVQITAGDLHIEYEGHVHRVGRLGTYATLPLDNGTLVGYVTRVGVHGGPETGSDAGKRPPAGMTVQLLGTLRAEGFCRGVSAYPTVGDPVHLGVGEDLQRIFGSLGEHADQDGRPRSFSLGRFAVDTDFEVRALGKEFFAKHVAIMGNSGSGKSVTTAKIMYEALRLPHAQFVLFDMHGEYRSAFSDDSGQPLPNVTYLSDRSLVLPYWMLRHEELERLFVDLNNPLNVNAQRIFLRSAMDRLKHKAAEELGLLNEYTVDTPIYYPIQQLKTYAQNMNEARFVLNTENYAFARLASRQLPPEAQELLLLNGRMEFNKGNSEGEVPHATYYGKLLGLAAQLEARLNDRRYDFLLRPLEQAARNPDLAGQFRADDGPGRLSAGVAAVIRQMLGRGPVRKNLTIVDLSGLPFDVVDVTVAVLTRTLFDFNFWAPPEVRQPLVLVFEEAHNYLPRVERRERMFARDAVEKVAKEGRKYGVSAMVVTQRPSEISETILSQCNSMILMRMNNPDDQNYAARVVSDHFRSLINLLPGLRPGEGFVIGDSVLMPMRTLIDAPPRLPRGGDVDFFKLWSIGQADGNVDQIMDRWWRQDRSPANKGATPGEQAAGKGIPGEPAVPGAAPELAHLIATSAQQRIAELAALLGAQKRE